VAIGLQPSLSCNSSDTVAKIRAETLTYSVPRKSKDHNFAPRRLHGRLLFLYFIPPKPTSNHYRGGATLLLALIVLSPMAEDVTNDREVGPGADCAAESEPNFGFLPADLSSKCRALIESYHTMHGFAGLPDMLWMSEARGIIESDRDLTFAFTRACRSRGAKRANDSFIAIAVIVMSLEVLADDFAGWGKRFPKAKSQAEKVLGDRLTKRRIELMNLYLYPSMAVRREFDTLTSFPTAAS
jgi:hypothetical protein